MTTATPISTALTDAAECCCSLSIPSSIRPRCGVLDAWVPTPRVHPILLRQESRFPHEQDVPRLLARHPGFVFPPGQRGLVERALLQKALPIGGFPHLLQQVDVVLFVLLGHTTGHEDA